MSVVDSLLPSLIQSQRVEAAAAVVSAVERARNDAKDIYPLFDSEHISEAASQALTNLTERT